MSQELTESSHQVKTPQPTTQDTTRCYVIPTLNMQTFEIHLHLLDINPEDKNNAIKVKSGPLARTHTCHMEASKILLYQREITIYQIESRRIERSKYRHQYAQCYSTYPAAFMFLQN